MSELPDMPEQIVIKMGMVKKSRPPIEIAYVDPEGDVEAAIGAIWCEVLHLANVGRDDNLFDLGGDSLHMIMIASRIRSRLESEISFGDFLDNPTVRGLAEFVQRA